MIHESFFPDHAGGGIVRLSNQFFGGLFIGLGRMDGLSTRPIPSGAPHRISLGQFDVDSRFQFPVPGPSRYLPGTWALPMKPSVFAAKCPYLPSTTIFRDAAAHPRQHAPSAKVGQKDQTRSAKCGGNARRKALAQRLLKLACVARY
jgi:hypothetical protein